MHTLLDRIQAVIAYTPLPGEPDPAHFVPLGATYVIPPQAELDPAVELASALQAVGQGPTAVFIPGTRFDATGTRYGRGGGWYDRFLAAAPQEWLRVGFCNADQLSKAPLERQPWDQPMDLICVIDGSVVTFVETRARGTF